MNKIICLLLFAIVLFSCDEQNASRPELNLENYDYKSSVLPDDEMKETSSKAVQLIQNKNYKAILNLIAEEVAETIPEKQLEQLVDHLHGLFEKNGVPTEDDIDVGIQLYVEGKDTVFINKILYNFRPTAKEPNAMVVTFAFLKKYGTQQLAGIFWGIDGIKDAKPNFAQIDKFDFSIHDIERFRIYYDEGLMRKTKFKNEIGFFAIEGDLNTLNEAGLTPIVEAMFDELKKSYYEKVEVLNSSFYRGSKPSFIQIEIGLKNKPYGIFIYLPIEDDGIYANKVVFIQKELGNLGYKFILNQDNYPTIRHDFPKIAKMELEKFYHDNP